MRVVQQAMGEIVHLRDTVPLPTVIEGVVRDTDDDYFPFVRLDTPDGLSDPLQEVLRSLDGKRVSITIEVLPD
jgi:hypothetical protein